MAYAFEKSGKLKPMTAEELAAADANSSVIVLDHGTQEDGTAYWLYIAVKPSKYKEFLRLTAARATIRYKEFGTILKYGFDKEVPLSVKEEMKREHGCDENFLANVEKELNTARVEFLKQQENNRIGDIVAMLKMKQEN